MGRIVLFLLGISTVFFVILLEGAHLSMLLNLGAAVLCIICPFLLSLVVYRSDLFNAFSAAFGGQVSESVDLKKSMEIILGLRINCLSMGGVGFLIGLMGFLATTSDPSKIGPWIAVAILSAVYATTIAELFLAPLINRLGILMLDPAELGPSSNGSDWKRAALTDLLLSIVLIFGGVFVEMTTGDAYYVQVGSALWVLAFVPFTTSIHGVGGYMNAFGSSYSPGSSTPAQRLHHYLVLSSTRTIIYALAGLGVAIGVAACLAGLDDPAKIWRGLAVVWCVPLYCVIAAEIFVAPRLRSLQIESVSKDSALGDVLMLANRASMPLRQSIVIMASTLALFLAVVFTVFVK